MKIEKNFYKYFDTHNLVPTHCPSLLKITAKGQTYIRLNLGGHNLTVVKNPPIDNALAEMLGHIQYIAVSIRKKGTRCKLGLISLNENSPQLLLIGEAISDMPVVARLLVKTPDNKLLILTISENSAETFSIASKLVLDKEHADFFRAEFIAALHETLPLDELTKIIASDEYSCLLEV